MKRHEKIHKLANAIREYRGQYDERSGVWKHPAKPSAGVRVARWIRELGLDGAESMNIVNGFKTFKEFNKWIGGL